MVNYQNAKIYRLISGSGKQYIGSTTQPLSKRKGAHKSYWKKGLKEYTSFILFEEKNGVDIALIEEYPCENKEQLHARERYWIENIEGGCVNKNIPLRTIDEWRQDNADTLKEQQKEYYQNNIDKIKEQHKEYYQNNIDKIKEQNKEYYQNNIDKIKEQNKEYYQNNIDKIKEYKKKWSNEKKDVIQEKKHNWYESNKDRILEKLKQIIKCDCGTEICRGAFLNHMKTKKHLEEMSKINDNQSHP
jgi:hypothetical protein